jgi:hypothetical protein
VTGVASGGTGAATLTTNNVILGNGTSAVQFVAPGSNGNVLKSNGTTWTSAAAGGGGFTGMSVFNSPGTFTTPATTTNIKVTVISGGGSGGSGLNPQPGGPGGSGAVAIGYYPVAASTPFPVTVGAGGGARPAPATPGLAGGTSSFSSLISATGGGAGTIVNNGGAGGTATGGQLNINGINSAAAAALYSVTAFSFTNGPRFAGFGASSAGTNGGATLAGQAGVVIVEF